MPIIRFPDLSKPKLNVEGKFNVKIVAISFKKSKNDTPMMKITFETLKSGRQITQYWPVGQCKKSLLHQNLKVILQDEDLDMVNTEDMFGHKCKIEVFKNSAGYLDVKAIPKTTSSDDKNKKS